MSLRKQFFMHKANSVGNIAYASKMPECDVLKLIELVEVNPCIWNTNIPAYSNETAKKCAWKNICVSLGGKYEEAVLRKKWSYLRSNFLVKLPLPTDSSSQEEVELRKFFGEMDFFRKVGAAQWKRKFIRAFATCNYENGSEPTQPQNKCPRLADGTTDEKPQPVPKETSEGCAEDQDINKTICNALYDQLCSRSKADADELRHRVTRALNLTLSKEYQLLAD